MPQPILFQELSHALGSPVLKHEPVLGGDINQAYRVTLADGRRVFVKTNSSAPASMFAAEADGLSWLAQSGAVHTPAVLAVAEADATVPFLVLEYLAPCAQQANFAELLGRALARLHRFGAPSFGHSRPNFIGSLPQSNGQHEEWHSFYREERLRPMVARAVALGLFDPAMMRKFDALYDRLSTLLGPSEPPARLHGDLWSGNLLVFTDGAPCLIDPAVYGGHREIDLAMMRLFGGFSDAVFAAYAEAYPLSPGHEERVLLYQLYPLLVHAILFGGSYVGRVRRVLECYV